MATLVSGRSCALRSSFDRHYTIKQLTAKEPFAVILEGVFYVSMAAAISATGMKLRRIQILAGRIGRIDHA